MYLDLLIESKNTRALPVYFFIPLDKLKIWWYNPRIVKKQTVDAEIKSMMLPQRVGES